MSSSSASMSSNKSAVLRDVVGARSGGASKKVEDKLKELSCKKKKKKVTCLGLVAPMVLKVLHLPALY